MPDIYKVDSQNIIGGPGRLVFKPFDGTYPETIEDVMDTSSPFNLKAGWRDLGATNDGITITRGFDTEDFEVDQVTGPVDTDITGWTHHVETTLAENTLENRQLALVGGTIIETPSTLGAPTTTIGALAAGATLVNVTTAAGFIEGGYAEMGGTAYRVMAINGSTLTVNPAVPSAVAAGASIAPVAELGSRRIGYGTVNDVPFHTYALISQKKDGTLYMAVLRRCKISGDDKDQEFSKSKRTIPLAFNAFSDGNVSVEENVYYEIEQVI